MGKIFRCLSGSVTILVRGNQLERFLNLCRSRNISMEHIRRKEGQITARIKIRDFFRLRPVRNKTGVHIQVTEKQGMPFFFLRSKKRKAFFAGFSLGLVLLFFLSGRIWNIHIQGNVQNSKPEILEFLEKQGVSHGMAKASVSCSEIAAAVRKQFPEITWVSARIEGTRLILEIQEGISEKREVQEETPCDLIANQDGTIVKMIVRSGVPVKKPGDTCKKGEVLVSGEVHIMNDEQEIQRYEYVHSDADIYISRKISYYKEIPLKNETLKKTGEESSGWYVKVGKWYLEIFGHKGDDWRKYSEEHPLYLTENFRLPLALGKVKQIKYRQTAGVYTEREAEDLAVSQLQDYERELMEKEKQILENHVRISVSKTACTARGTILVVEKTGKEASTSNFLFKN